MKKFSKMLALGLAAVLVFGMNAQAAGSTSADDSEVESNTWKDNASVPDKIVVDGQEVEIEAPTVLDGTQLEEVKTTVATETAIKGVQEAVKQMMPNVGFEFVGEPKVAAAFNLEAPKGLTQEQIAKGVKIPFTLKEVKSNVRYSVIHYLANGGYEVLPVTIEGNTIYATFTSFSPVVIVEQEVKVSTGSSSSDDADDSTPNAAVSPKTGEAVPVAGIMALVLMAGAVICAKKVRYNR